MNCNTNLFKWKISYSEICEFCEPDEKYTIGHALSKCAKTRLFLTDVFELIYPYKRSVQCIDIEQFIFGVQDSALNLMFLLIKKLLSEADHISNIIHPQFCIEMYYDESLLIKQP